MLVADVADVWDLLPCAGPPSGTPWLACTPSPRVRARLMRFAPAVRPAPRVLRVLRRHNPFVRLAPRRRSRVPTRVTSEDGLGVPFGSLRLFTTAQLPRSASGPEMTMFRTAGWGKEDYPTSTGAPELYPPYPARAVDGVSPGIQPM